jgi:cell division transport system permease protein
VIRPLILLRYQVRSALGGLRSSALPAIAATLTITFCLLIVGSFGLLLRNMQELLDRFGRDLRVTAFLEADLKEKAVSALVERVGRLPGIESVELISRDEALRRFREGVGGRSGLLEGLDENPLPPSVEVTLLAPNRTPEGIRGVAAALAGVEGVDEVASGHEWVEGYARVLGLARAAGLGLGGVFVLAALLIVANTFRLAVYARRDEVEILELVGASRIFVRVPIVLEGLAQGAAGGLFALGLLFALFRFAVPALTEGLVFLLGFAEPRFLTAGEAGILVASGAALGALGSFLALVHGRRP